MTKTSQVSVVVSLASVVLLPPLGAQAISGLARARTRATVGAAVICGPA